MNDDVPLSYDKDLQNVSEGADSNNNDCAMTEPLQNIDNKIKNAALLEKNGLETHDKIASNEVNFIKNIELSEPSKKTSVKKKHRDKKRKNKKRGGGFWPLKAFFLTLILSGVFTLVSESVTTNVQSIIFIYALVVVLIFINIMFDIVGLAFASCDIAPFYAQASKKVKGAKLVLKLLKNADVVSNVCNDVIGDICGIVSGAAGMALTVRLASGDSRSVFLVSILVSSLIAAFTVCGKAVAKRYAINNSQKIVERIGKILSIFIR